MNDTDMAAGRGLVPSGYSFDFGVRDLALGECYRRLAARALRQLRSAAKRGYICPRCGNGSGPDGTGMEFSASGSYAGRFHCYRCGLHGDIVDVAREMRLDRAEGESTGIQLDSQNAGGQIDDADLPDVSTPEAGFLDPAAAAQAFAGSEAEAYARSRGLTAETCARFGLGMGYSGRNGAALIIPEASSPGWYVARALDPQATPKTLNARGSVPLFNAAALDTHPDEPGRPRVVFVTESAICAMSIEQSGYPAVALCGAGQHQALLSRLAARSADRRPLLALTLDADAAGADATEKLAAALRSLGCECRDVRAELYASSDAKDPNDLLLAGSLPAALARAQAAMESITLGFGARPLREAQKQTDDLLGDRPADSTGLAALDTILCPLRPGLHVFGALPGVGKTTLLLQLARYFQRTRDVLFCSLEMSVSEIHARLLSQLSAELLLPQLCAVRDDLGSFRKLLSLRPAAADIYDVRRRRLLPDETRRLIELADAALPDETRRLRVLPPGRTPLTVMDLKSELTRHLQLRGELPIVIIDYLQYLSAEKPDLGTQTDKQAVDQLVSDLKCLALDLQLTIFLISSFNRQNYFSDVNLGSFKESGNIEYTADLAIGIQPWAPELLVTAGDDRMLCKGPEVKRLASVMPGPRYLELCVMKARLGETRRVILAFDGRSGTFNAGSHTDKAAQGWKSRATRLLRLAARLPTGLTDIYKLRELVTVNDNPDSAQLCIWPLDLPEATLNDDAREAPAPEAADNLLFLDLETYSSVDIRDGIDAYVRAPDFRIILCCWARGPDEVHTVDLSDPTAKLPDGLLAMLADTSITKVAHNAAFELACLTAAGIENLDPLQWHDTLLHAHYCRLPGALKQLAPALGLSFDLYKSIKGVELIPVFCRPEKAVKRRPIPRPLTEIITEDPSRWSDFTAYCVQDVVTLRAVYAALSKRLLLPELLRIEWATDYVINRRGLQIDTELCKACVELSEKAEAADLPRFAWLTDGLQPTQTAQVLTWLQTHGLPQLKTLSGTEIKRCLLELDLDPKLREILELRLEHARTSTSKYATALALADSSGRLRGQLEFYAARTGRWKSRGVQLHNLPRPDSDCAEMLGNLRDLARTGDPDVLAAAGVNTKKVLASLVRTIFIPSPGTKVMTVCDYSQIEPRVAAWLTGETWRQELLSADGPLYETTAARAFGVDAESVKNGGEHHDLRQIGKLMELSLGYAAGHQRYRDFCKNYGLELSDDDARDHVRRWRDACPRIVGAWTALSSAATEAVRLETDQVAQLSSGVPLSFRLRRDARRPGLTGFEQICDTLLADLPSGRSLCYVHPHLVPAPDYRACLGTRDLVCRSESGCRDRLHGGLLLENVVQALARDILADAITRAERSGLRVLFHVHDEIICDGSCLDQLQEIMSVSPPWAKGLKLSAAGFTSQYYKKE